mgnify:FL=1
MRDLQTQRLPRFHQLPRQNAVNSRPLKRDPSLEFSQRTITFVQSARAWKSLLNFGKLELPTSQRHEFALVRSATTSGENTDQEHYEPYIQTQPKGFYVKVVAEPELLRFVVDVLRNLVDEVLLKFDEERLTISSVDPTVAAMAHIVIDQEAFEAFEVEEPLTIGVQLDHLREVSSLSGYDESMVTLTLDPSVGLFNMAVGSLLRKTTPVNENNIPNPQIPKIPSNATVVLKGKQLSHAMKAVSMVSDNVEITVKEDEISFLGNRGNEDRMEVTYSSDELEKIECGDGMQRSTYTVGYLNGMSRQLESLPNDLVFSISTEAPLKVEFVFADEAGTGLFLLAPRQDHGTY